MYSKNAASPERIAVGAIYLIADGTIQTADAAVRVMPQGGAAGAGGGTLACDATSGIWHYIPTQAETNYTSFMVMVYKASCTSACATIVTTEATTTLASILEDTGTTLPTAIADLPTVAEFEARTLPAADYVVVTDTIAGVTTVGSVTGAVGSVTGAVGSVTGAVGSVTGNVGGNVVGSVGSVSGDTKQTADVATLITTVGVAGAGLTALATQASVNDVPTNAELAIALAAADDAVLAAIAALNNLSSAQAQAAATAALNAYDPPTNAEMEARTLLAADYFDSSTDTVTLANGAHGGAAATLVLSDYTNFHATSVTVSDKTGFKLASDGLDSISTTGPAGVAANFREMVVQLWRRFFGKSTLTADTLTTYDDAGTTAATEQTVSDDETTQTMGKALSA